MTEQNIFQPEVWKKSIENEQNPDVSIASIETLSYIILSTTNKYFFKHRMWLWL